MAVFNIFLGGGELFMIDDGGAKGPPLYIHLTTSGEWGGLIAYGTKCLRAYPGF